MKIEKKDKFLLSVIIGIPILGIIGVACWLIYFATQVSATYPPLKEYRFTLGTKELGALIKKSFDDDPSITLKMTGTVGSSQNRTYSMDIGMRIDSTIYKYNINYEIETLSNSRVVKIALVGAFDITHHIGGYRIQDRGLDNLITLFENRFIERLKSTAAQ